MYYKEVRLTLIERVLNAFTVLCFNFFSGIFSILSSPLFALEVLFKKTKSIPVWEMKDFGLKNPPKDFNPDDNEPWKKEHDNEYN